MFEPYERKQQALSPEGINRQLVFGVERLEHSRFFATDEQIADFEDLIEDICEEVQEDTYSSHRSRVLRVTADDAPLIVATGPDNDIPSEWVKYQPSAFGSGPTTSATSITPDPKATR